MNRHRCSSLPRIAACSLASVPIDNPYDPDSAEGTLGTAAHECLAELPMGGTPDIDVVAQRYNVDTDDLQRLVSFGERAWRELEPFFPFPEVEVRLSGPVCFGTADVASADSRLARICDWKTGRVERSHEHQLKGYASAYRESRYAPIDGFELYTVWLEAGHWDRYAVTLGELDAWEANLGKHLATPTATPGEHCGYCPRQLECPTRDAYLRSAYGALAEVGELAVDASRLASIYPRVQQLEKAVEAYRKALRLVLARGAVPRGDGKVLRLGERSTETITDAALAADILATHGFTLADTARCVSMSKTMVRKVIAEKCPEGAKEMVGTVLDDLREAGLITTTRYTAIETAKGG